MAKKSRVIVDIDGLDKMKKRLNRVSDEIVQKVAQDTETYIKAHFSPASPSEPGQPPGVDTGNLINSIVVRPDGGKWVLLVGADYAAHLEYGTKNKDGSTRMAARPFVRPAIEWIKDHMPPGMAVKIIKGD